MARVKIEDLSIQRTLEANETDNIVGAGGISFYIGPGGGYYGRGPSWRGRRRRRHFHHHHRPPVYHDTSHWDYHPGGLRRHGNHYHYVPGHYHWHQDGHWHY